MDSLRNLVDSWGIEIMRTRRSRTLLLKGNSAGSTEADSARINHHHHAEHIVLICAKLTDIAWDGRIDFMSESQERPLRSHCGQFPQVGLKRVSRA